MKEDLLKTLARCRVITVELIKNYLHISIAALDELLKENLIVMVTEKHGSRIYDYYRLTLLGEKYIRNHIPEIKELYRGCILEQDLLLCEFYLRRNCQEKNSWLTREDLVKEYKIAETVDGMFVNEKGEREGVKVLSNKSPFSDVERVEEFARRANIARVNYLLY